MNVEQALQRLLAGTGYRARKVGETAWRIERVAAPVPVVRDPADAPPDATLSPAPPPVPIIVTGTKQDRLLLDLPMAVSTVTMAPHHRADPASNTGTVMSEMEGLALTALGPGRNRMFVRGVSDSAFNGESQSTVAVVLDDSRVTYAAPDPDIRLVDVERVEVLKGPQGSLYGIGALGGIYHIVTRRPDLGDASLVASAGAMTTRSGTTGLSGSVTANLPLVHDAVAVRLVGYTTKEPGWIDTGARRNANSTRVTGARGGLGIDLGGDWRADFSGFAQWVESRDSRYVYEPRTLERPAQEAEPHDNDLRHIAARIARTTHNVDIVLSTGMTWHEVGDTLDATVGAEDFGVPDPLLLEDSRDYRVWDNEARISGHWDDYSWLVGMSHVQSRQKNIWDLTARSGVALVIDDDRRTTYDTALFGNVTVPLATGVSAEGGLRAFRSVTRETRLLSDGPVTRKRERNGMTPSLALSWQPSADQLLFVRYGSAFRQGGSDIGPDGQLETLKSDELATVEMGWRQQLGRRGSLDIGAWYSWWENLQSDLLEENGLIETANAGDATIYGWEVSASFDPHPTWRIEAGGNFTMAKLTDNTLGFEIGDRHLPAVPEYTFRASVRHDFPLGPANAWVRVRARYVGPSHLSFDPELDREMGNYFETGAEFHARTGNFELAVAADNLFGSKADLFSFGNTLRLREMEQFTPQRPRTISVALIGSF
ncbi:MAG: TonB-dependent receptor [Novosphingobium sp.]|nr:TonB-dependent receptor [Novosphingobium sp.]